jgi:hypothetical protein
MVVNKIDVEGESVFKPKGDAPVLPHCNSPRSYPISLEFVEIISGKVKALRTGGGV